MDSTRPRWGHRSIADDLDRQIRSGRLQPGEPLPGRRELAKEYGVSETTVYRALGLLRDRGLTLGHQGKAVFVADVIPEKSAAPPAG